MSPHVVAAVTGHGYGHHGQIAPVLRALINARPDIELTVRSALDRNVIERLFGVPFVHEPPASEVVVPMLSPNDVDAPAANAAYKAYHATWQDAVATEAQTLRALAPDLIVADIPYVTLAAAKSENIPAVAFCSLNWHDIFAAYSDDSQAAHDVLDQMEKSYGCADVFIQCAPHLPMDWHPRRRPVGPVANLGQDRRAEIDARLNAKPTDQVVLISYGGIAGGFPVENLPRRDGLWWILGDLSMGNRADSMNYADLNMPFVDVVRSVDAVVSKPGYGLFTECACNGTRLLYADRPDWPETPYLSSWIESVGTAVSVQPGRLQTGDIEDTLFNLLDRPSPVAIKPTGIDAAVQIILDFVDPSPVLSTQPLKTEGP